LNSDAAAAAAAAAATAAADAAAGDDSDKFSVSCLLRSTRCMRIDMCACVVCAALCFFLFVSFVYFCS
jgi:hypothetical protein